MIIMFTGPRAGYNNFQRQILLDLIAGLPWQTKEITFMHGACVGSDEGFHSLLFQVLNHMPHEILCRTTIEVHPSNLNEYVSEEAMTWPGCNLRIYPAQPPKKRNTTMAQKCNILWATPLTETMSRSGTWHSIGEVQKLYKPIRLIHRGRLHSIRC